MSEWAPKPLELCCATTNLVDSQALMPMASHERSTGPFLLHVNFHVVSVDSVKEHGVYEPVLRDVVEDSHPAILELGGFVNL